MADQFIGEIRVVPFNFAPNGWALCNGQLIAISQNTALFSLLGVQFGGNGTSNFALPNLQGQVPIGSGQGAGLTSRVVGESGGSEGVALVSTEIPPHLHLLNAANSATTESPTGAILSTSARPIYAPRSGVVQMAPAIQPTGGNAPHENRQPFLVMNYIIALTGVFPPRQ